MIANIYSMKRDITFEKILRPFFFLLVFTSILVKSFSVKLEFKPLFKSSVAYAQLRVIQCSQNILVCILADESSNVYLKILELKRDKEYEAFLPTAYTSPIYISAINRSGEFLLVYPNIHNMQDCLYWWNGATLKEVSPFMHTDQWIVLGEHLLYSQGGTYHQFFINTQTSKFDRKVHPYVSQAMNTHFLGDCSTEDQSIAFCEDSSTLKIMKEPSNNLLEIPLREANDTAQLLSVSRDGKKLLYGCYNFDAETAYYNIMLLDFTGESPAKRELYRFSSGNELVYQSHSAHTLLLEKLHGGHERALRVVSLSWPKGVTELGRLSDDYQCTIVKNPRISTPSVLAKRNVSLERNNQGEKARPEFLIWDHDIQKWQKLQHFVKRVYEVDLKKTLRDKNLAIYDVYLSETDNALWLIARDAKGNFEYAKLQTDLVPLFAPEGYPESIIHGASEDGRVIIGRTYVENQELTKKVRVEKAEAENAQRLKKELEHFKAIAIPESQEEENEFGKNSIYSSGIRHSQKRDLSEQLEFWKSIAEKAQAFRKKKLETSSYTHQSTHNTSDLEEILSGNKQRNDFNAYLDQYIASSSSNCFTRSEHELRGIGERRAFYIKDRVAKFFLADLDIVEEEGEEGQSGQEFYKSKVGNFSNILAVSGNGKKLVLEFSDNKNFTALVVYDLMTEESVQLPLPEGCTGMEIRGISYDGSALFGSASKMGISSSESFGSDVQNLACCWIFHENSSSYRAILVQGIEKAKMSCVNASSQNGLCYVGETIQGNETQAFIWYSNWKNLALLSSFPEEKDPEEKEEYRSKGTLEESEEEIECKSERFLSHESACLSINRVVSKASCMSDLATIFAGSSRGRPCYWFWNRKKAEIYPLSQEEDRGCVDFMTSNGSLMLGTCNKELVVWVDQSPIPENPSQLNYKPRTFKQMSLLNFLETTGVSLPKHFAIEKLKWVSRDGKKWIVSTKNSSGEEISFLVNIP